MVDLKAEILFHNKHLQHFIGHSCKRAARAVMFHLTNPVRFFILVVFRTWYIFAFLDFFCNNISEVTILIVEVRGATGAARAPKPGKAPIMAARRRYRRRLLFFKIEVRPRPCWPYRVRRRWKCSTQVQPKTAQSVLL